MRDFAGSHVQIFGYRFLTGLNEMIVQSTNIFEWHNKRQNKTLELKVKEFDYHFEPSTKVIARLKKEFFHLCNWQERDRWCQEPLQGEEFPIISLIKENCEKLSTSKIAIHCLIQCIYIPLEAKLISIFIAAVRRSVFVSDSSILLMTGIPFSVMMKFRQVSRKKSEFVIKSFSWSKGPQTNHFLWEQREWEWDFCVMMNFEIDWEFQ